jgi:hypothetical protein
MSRAEELLKQATPLPWGQIGQTIARGLHSVARTDERMEDEELANAALIVYAVNRLSDYEAAVEALDRLTDYARDLCRHNERDHECTAGALTRAEGAVEHARAALRRLRDEVPA